MNDCELCASPGGEIIWQNNYCRVVHVTGAEREQYPGYCRAIWREHVKEMSDLTSTEMQHLMKVVCSVEQALRQLLQPDKMNLASLGNITPHLHWHIIPRFRDDHHFPAPIWAEPRPGIIPAKRTPILDGLALHEAITRSLTGIENEECA